MKLSSFCLNGLDKFTRITSSCPSTKVNVWKVNINDVGYLITPAHVALLAKDDFWRLSPLLEDFDKYNWKIPYSYAMKPSPLTDICWAKLPSENDESYALTLDESELVEPLNVDVIFRQPYDMDGKNIGNASMIGSTKATLYKSPSDGLIESIDIGFRGMSGAIAISAESNIVGMFVKRGGLIGLRKPSPIEYDTIEYNYSSTPFEKRMFEEIINLKKELLELRKTALTKDDVTELGVVFDARRGIFLPSKTIVSALCHMKSICVNDVVGTCFPS